MTLGTHLVLMLLSRLVGGLSLESSMGSSCPPEKLVVYKLELQTFWDEQTFPKQYPQVDEMKLLGKMIFLLSGVQVLSGQRLWVSIDFHNIKTKQGLPYFIGDPSCFFF